MRSGRAHVRQSVLRREGGSGEEEAGRTGRTDAPRWPQQLCVKGLHAGEEQKSARAELQLHLQTSTAPPLQLCSSTPFLWHVSSLGAADLQESRWVDVSLGPQTSAYRSFIFPLTHTCPPPSPPASTQPGVFLLPEPVCPVCPTATGWLQRVVLLATETHVIEEIQLFAAPQPVDSLTISHSKVRSRPESGTTGGNGHSRPWRVGVKRPG